MGSTVSGNNGNGIFNFNYGGGGNSRLEVTGSTIANNNAVGNGGDIRTYTQSGAGNTATTTLRNTIIAGNTPNNLATGTVNDGAATAKPTLPCSDRQPVSGICCNQRRDLQAFSSGKTVTLR